MLINNNKFKLRYFSSTCRKLIINRLYAGWKSKYNLLNN